MGVNRYRLLGRADPAPHLHNRRSPRYDMGVTSPTSWGGSAARSGRADALVDPSQRIAPDPDRIAAMIAAVLAADAAP